MKKSIIVIGAGMGGLAAGIYGRLNGFDTTIFEMHSLPGGQCCSWKRKGYTFDGCIHHLMGCDPSTKLYSFWEELGAMPRTLGETKECVSVAAPDGTTFNDWWDIGLLDAHMKNLSPADSEVIDDYIGGIRDFAEVDLLDNVMFGSMGDIAKAGVSTVPLLKWFKPTMEDFARRFKDPFLARAFPLVEYSTPISPFFLHLAKHASGIKGDIQWPEGGALGLAKSIEKRYKDLGGEVVYKSPVVKILTDAGKATGVKLSDGSVHRADVVISNADGRKTIMDMLGGEFVDKKINLWCSEPEDVTNWGVHVFLGVDRDLSEEPSALVQLLDGPVTIAEHTTDSLEMQIFGMDPTMAPEGKGTIKVELFSSYSYWKGLSEDRARYDEEKQMAAEQVIDLLDSTRFPGIKSQVEVVDVSTLMTWERFMGGTHGFMVGPKKKFSPNKMFFGKGYFTLPGLEDMYMVGTWATEAGALFANAQSGKKTIEMLCKKNGIGFRSS